MITYKTSNTFSTMNEVHDHGYSIVSGITTIEEYVSFGASLGEFFVQKDAEECKPYVLVSEENRINKLGFSHLGLFPHTDRSILKNPPDLILLWCQQPSEKGGESLIVDMRKAIDALKKENFSLYQEILATTAVFSDENHTDFYHSKVFYQDGVSTYIRFRNDNYIFFPPKSCKVYERLLNLINAHTVEYKLSKGEVIIINNKRILHGRKEFVGHRALYRLHVNTIQKMRGCL